MNRLYFIIPSYGHIQQYHSTVYSGIVDERSCQNSAKGSFFHNNLCTRPASLKQAEETKMTLQTQGQGICFKRPTSLKHVEETKMTV